MSQDDPTQAFTPQPADLDATAAQTPSERASELVEVLEDYRRELEAGRHPDSAVWIARHAELAPELERCLTGIEFAHRAAGQGGLGPGRTIGEFRILREVGRGGMGVVYEAEQISLGRRVALKVLRFGPDADAEAMRRFEGEAQTAAQLHHTNIVPVFAVGCEQGVQYFAMQFIEGKSLADVANEAAAAKRPVPPAEVAGWGLQAAEALDHAHKRGVVHRDVKPANLLLDGEGVVWLSDFGLAKRMDQTTLTLAGAVLGTPRYMSPEQAAATRTPIDHRTDLYSLGATLYELATGAPVFPAKTPHEILSQIIHREPTPPRRLAPNLPRDLETIVLKCLAKDPAGRYKSARDLAADLRAFLDGRAISARRESFAESAVRWARRNPAAAGLVGVSAASVLTIAVLLAVSREIVVKQYLAAAHALERAVTARREAMEQRLLADHARSRAEDAQAASDEAARNAIQARQQASAALEEERRTAYRHTVGLAHAEWLGGRVSAAKRLLDGCPESLRNWEWNYLNRVARSEVAREALSSPASLVRYAPAGDRIFTAGSGNGVSVRDFDGKRLRLFDRHTQAVQSLVVARDGARVASGSASNIWISNESRKGEILIWRHATGEVLHTFGGDHQGLTAIALGSGERLYSTGGDHTLRLWDMASGKELKRRAFTATEVRVSADAEGKRLVVDLSDRVLRVDPETLEDVQEYKDLGSVNQAHLSPNGRLLAVGCVRSGAVGGLSGEHEIHLLDVESGRRLGIGRPSSMPGAVSFAPDGGRVAVGCFDHAVQIWTTPQMGEPSRLRGCEEWVGAVQFSPDGKRLAAVDGNGLTSLFGMDAPGALTQWDVTNPQEYREWKTTKSASDLDVQHGRAAVLDASGVEVHDLASQKRLWRFEGFAKAPSRLACDAAGRFVAVAAGEEVRIFAATDGKLQRTIPIDDAETEELAFRADGAVLAVAGGGAGVRVFNVDDGRRLWTFFAPDRGGAHVVFLDGGRLLARSNVGGLQLSDREDARETPGEVRVWDLETGERVATLEADRTFIQSLAASPQGDRLALSHPKRLRLFDLRRNAPPPLAGAPRTDSATPVEAAANRKHTAAVQASFQAGSLAIDAPSISGALSFSSDGGRLAGLFQGLLRVWDADDGREVLSLRGTWTKARFDGQGRWLVATNGDRLFAWDGAPPAPAAPSSEVAAAPPPEASTAVAAAPKAVEAAPKFAAKPAEQSPANRPAEVTKALQEGFSLLQSGDRGGALVWFTEALRLEPDPARRAVHRLRIGLVRRQLPAYGSDAPKPLRTARPEGLETTDEHGRIFPDGRRHAVWNVAWSDKLQERRLRLFDLTTGVQEGPTIRFGKEEWCWSKDFVVSPDGATGAAILGFAGTEHNLQAWDLKTGETRFVVPVKIKERRSSDLSFTPDGRWLRLGLNRGDSDGEMQLFSAADGKRLEFESPYNLAWFSPDGALALTGWNYYAAGHAGGATQVWRTADRTKVGPALSANRLEAAAFSPDGKLLALGDSQKLRIVEVASGSDHVPPQKLAFQIDQLRFAADGRSLAYSAEKEVGTVDADTGAIRWKQAAAKYQSLAFAAEETVLVGMGNDRVELWDAAYGDPLCEAIPYHDEMRPRLPELTADGRTLFVRAGVPYSDGDPQVWDSMRFDRWELQPDPRPLEELQAAARLLAARALDTNGKPIPLGGASAEADWKQVRRSEAFKWERSNGEEAIQAWYVCGPFDLDWRDPDDAARGQEAPWKEALEARWSRTLPCEQPVDFTAAHVGREGSEIRWRIVPSEKSRPGNVDLGEPLLRRSYAEAVAVVHLYSPAGGSVEAAIGSPRDGLQVRVRGVEVHRGIGTGRADSQRRQFKFDLAPGWNELRVRVVQRTGPWGFTFAVLQSEGLAWIAPAPPGMPVPRNADPKRAKAKSAEPKENPPVDLAAVAARLRPNAPQKMLPYLDALADADPTVQEGAVSALGEATESPRLAAEILVEAMRIPKLETAAAAAVVRLGPEAGLSEAELARAVEAAGYSEPLVRFLAKQGPRARGAAKGLAKLLPHIANNQRTEVHLALAAMQPDPGDVLPEVVRSINEYQDGREAENTIRRIVEAHPEASLPILRRMLDDDKVSVRRGAAEALGRLGAVAAPAAAALQRLVEDYSLSDELDLDERRVLIAAALAAWRMDPREKWPLAALQAQLKKGDGASGGWNGEVRTIHGFVVEAIGEMGPAAASAVPAVVENARRGWYPRPALRALGKIGPAAKEAVPLLKKYAVKGDDRGAAIEAWLKIEPDSTELPPLLEGLLADDAATSDERVQAARRLHESAPAGDAARVVHLVKLIRYRNGDDDISKKKSIRKALELLAEIGASAQPAAAAIVEAVQAEDAENAKRSFRIIPGPGEEDEYRILRVAAESALPKIDSAAAAKLAMPSK